MRPDNRRKQGKPVSYSEREVPYEGQVGAGRLLTFVPKEGSIAVAVPDDIPDSEPLGTMTVNGKSLEGVGIYDGDIALVRKVFSRKSIRRDTVCVLYLKTLGEVVAKKISFEKDHVVLHYCGMEPEPPMYVPAADVEVRGIVISASRHRTEWPFTHHESDEDLLHDNGQKKPSPAEKKERLEKLVNRFKKKSESNEVPF